MSKLTLFFAIGVGFIAVVFWVQWSEFAAVDRCLDGGGRWDYDANTCDP